MKTRRRFSETRKCARVVRRAETGFSIRFFNSFRNDAIPHYDGCRIFGPARRWPFDGLHYNLMRLYREEHDKNEHWFALITDLSSFIVHYHYEHTAKLQLKIKKTNITRQKNEK